MVKMIHDHFKMTIDNNLKPMQDIMPSIIKSYKDELKKKDLKEKDREVLKEKIDWYGCYLRQNKIIQEIFEKFEEEFKDKASGYTNL
jgi:hypothetical protein